jgi:hypothetical protein
MNVTINTNEIEIEEGTLKENEKENENEKEIVFIKKKKAHNREVILSVKIPLAMKNEMMIISQNNDTNLSHTVRECLRRELNRLKKANGKKKGHI